jgi:two-component system sensor histidine kinase HydH
MTGVPGFMQRGIIQPKYILAIVAILMVIMMGMGLYELSASRRDIIRVLEEEAMSLAESISVMSDNSLTCFSKIEDLMTTRLLNNAELLERMDYAGRLSEEILAEISERNDIYQISVFGEDGRRILDSRRQETPGMSEVEYIDPSLVSLLDGTKEEMVVGWTAGIHRRKGGAIILDLDAEKILEFRKSMGIGSVIQSIGENEGIDYIVLQDEVGLVLASQNVTRMRRIAGDDFLEEALRNRWLDTRVYSFEGEDVLEVVSPFQIDNSSYGLFRIGLSMDEVHAVEARSRQRLILTVFVMFVVAIVSLSFLLVSQNYSLLSKAYNRMQTHTGMVLENIADGIIVLDNKGIISVFNRAAERIFRRAENEAVGTSVDGLDPAIREMLEDAANIQSSDRSSEIKVRVPEAGERLLSVRVSSFAGAGGETDSVIVIVRDVTEERAMEENIRRTEQLTAMGKLASAVAHEVRNPLNAISMIAQRLGREFSPSQGEEDYRGLVGTVRSESARINGIIEEFLRFARPPKLNRQPVDMDELLSETVSLIRAQAMERGIEIDEVYSSLGVWNVDREQTKQVLLNLLLNGIEAMPGGGSLSIKSYVVEGRLCVEISDTGGGIPEEDLPRIFDLYFTTKDAGTGLGLSIVQRVVAEHGGWIDVDSEPGKGTTFRICLPEEVGADE